MAHYLVSAKVTENRLDDLESRLAADEFADLEPFGEEVSHALKNARRRADGAIVWEEEDYCQPPLAQEREAVLDRYFERIDVEPVESGAGWRRIAELPPLFPKLAKQNSEDGR